ncbi:MAG: DUF805 domain-containing protein [Chitinophagaceae bacterium]|nr:DUF805 domain-containing protein [Chitinophagaceae bacterium]
MFGWWKKVVFENYSNFNGRARRSEYWYFTLATLILILPFYALALIGALSESRWLTTICGMVYLLAALGLFLPSLAVAVRRLHDIGKSGWYYLIGLIPFIGGIILLVWFFTEGTRGTNEYGEDPKNPAGPDFDFEQDGK